MQNAIEKEIELLEALQKEGLSTVEIIQKTTYNGQPAIIMKKYAQGSKDIVRFVDNKVKIVGKSEILNKKSIQDLNRIRNKLVEEKIKIDDLQFLIGADGSVVIADPLNVFLKTPPSNNNLNMIRQLIKVAEDNVFK